MFALLITLFVVRFGKLPRVKVSEVTHAHLISYHPDRDLLPMVMSNCQYTFEVGRGTKVEYNFSNLERQLMDRFLFSKSVIDLHPREVINFLQAQELFILAFLS